MLPKWPSLANWPMILKIAAIIILMIGVYRVIYAFLNLDKSFSTSPYPNKHSKLITNGIYKNFRHPIYNGICLMSISICLFYGSIIHLFLFYLLNMLQYYHKKNAFDM